MVFPATKRQILVVDSNSVYTKNLVHILEEHGFDTTMALSSQEAISKATFLDLDMIIIGENLTDDNCFSMCKRLKASKETAFIPVVIITEDCQSQQRIKGYHLGADDCIGKDFDSEELFARMEVIWRRSNGAFHNMHEERQKSIVQELSRIIDNGLIAPHFQPIYALNPFRLFGIEVLSRPYSGGLLTNAEDLFKAAIKYDMYYPLEMLCWRKAVDVITRHTRNENIFFNCSPYIVENAKFPTVKKVFEQSRMPFDRVVMEITERSSITEYALFYERLKEYREYGFSFAVDDVGGGYASLESIVATKPEIVKVDAHIVRDLHIDSVKRSIVKFIISFCKENKIVSIAEGVETREEMEAVTALGVDAVQGYYLARPTADFNLHNMKDVCVSYS